MRKNTCYVIQLVAILLVISLRALGQNVPSVKIIHFGVGSADCALIVIKDFDTRGINPGFHTITALIDTGSSRSDNLDAPTLWRRIWRRIDQEGGKQLDYFVLSHIHEDHVGNAKGILQEIKTQGYSWRHQMIIIDRYAFADARIEAPYNGKTVIYRGWKGGTEASPSPPMQFVDYNKYYNEHFNGATITITVTATGEQTTFVLPPQRRQLFFGQDLFKIGRDYELKNVQMVCVASNGVIGDREIPQRSATDRPKNENDLGFAFLLRFGSFRYFTGADLGFDVSDYTNMEDPLVEQLRNDWKHDGYPFHVCALKVNHHGSEKSTNDNFVRFFDPQVAVFSSSLRKFGQGSPTRPPTRLPTEAVIRRLCNPNCSPSATEEPIRFLLYTFRLSIPIPIPRPQFIITDVDPMRNFHNYRYWENGGPQDVTLHVKREEDGTPIETNRPPKIYMYKQLYLNGGTPEGPEVNYSPDHVICKRLHNNEHKNLPLPSLRY